VKQFYVSMYFYDSVCLRKDHDMEMSRELREKRVERKESERVKSEDWKFELNELKKTAFK